MRTRHVPKLRTTNARYTCERGMYENRGRRMSFTCRRMQRQCSSRTHMSHDMRRWYKSITKTQEHESDSRHDLRLRTYNELSLGTSGAGWLWNTLWKWAGRKGTLMDPHGSRSLLPRLWWTDMPKTSVSTFKNSQKYLSTYFSWTFPHYEHLYSKSLLPPQGEHIWKLKWTGPNQFIWIYVRVISKYVYLNVYIEIGIKSMANFSFLFHALLCSST